VSSVISNHLAQLYNGLNADEYNAKFMEANGKSLMHLFAGELHSYWRILLTIDRLGRIRGSNLYVFLEGTNDPVNMCSNCTRAAFV